MAKPKSLAFPFFIALTVALLGVVHQFTLSRGGSPSASAAAQTVPIPKNMPREPQAGETQIDGWLSVTYGDPAAAFGVETEESAHVPARIVALLDDAGSPIIDVAMPETLLTEHYGDYVRVIGTLRADTGELAERGQMRAAQSDAILDVRAVFLSPAPTRGAELQESRLVSGSQNWINLLCKFADKPATPNIPSFYQSLFSTTEPGLDHYWQQLSYGNIDLAGTETVTEWKVLPHPRSYYVGTSADLNALRQDCTAIHDADVFFPDFVGVNLFFNDNLDCCAWGGGASMSLDGQTKFYRTTYLPTWAVNHGVIAHEMGHGYGFPHSTGPANNPPSDLSVYVSQWDVMSASQGTCAVSSPSYQCLGPGTIAYHLDIADWIPPERIVTVNTGSDMTFTLERTVLPQSDDLPLMAIVPLGTSTTFFYTIEARNIGAGYDQNIPASAVIIHDVNTSRMGNGGHAYVVDADTNNVNTNDAGSQWLPGETYNDVARGISIQVLSQSGSTFTVRVINNSITPTAPPPPTNDLFMNARPVSSGTTYTQEWLGATDSITDPVPTCVANGFSSTVWFKFTPSTSGSITLDTIGSSSSSGGLVDTVLAVYTGTEGALTEVACNDDIVLGVNVVSRATFHVTAGTQYYAAVGSYGLSPVSVPTTLFLSLSGITGGSTSTPTRTATATPTRTPTMTRTPVFGQLVRNGGFDQLDSNGLPTHWSIYGLPQNPIWQVVNGVFEFVRQDNSQQGVIFQDLNTIIMTSQFIQTQVDLGNSSAQRKRAVILLHDGDFSDLFVCNFWLPPNTPLTTFRMTGYPTEGWTDAHISIYLAPEGGDGYLQIDNVTVNVETIVFDDYGSNAVLCYDPFAP